MVHDPTNQNDLTWLVDGELHLHLASWPARAMVESKIMEMSLVWM